MMKEILSHLKGDKIIWALVFLLAMFSFMPVFSASTNLVYTVGAGTTTAGYLFKHLVHLSIGMCALYFVHKMPYHRFRAISFFAMIFVIILLLLTAFQGKTIGGANANRWVNIPFVNVSIQTSSVASVVLMVYVAQYLANFEKKVVTFKSSLVWLWLPVFIVVGLILPSNLSTAALIFVMVCMLVYVGRYPIKYLAVICATGLVALMMFFLVAKAFPSVMPNRVDTWLSRIDRFTAADHENVDVYQIENAKIAIATGGIGGLGPGKSVQKNFLPQSSSDFIYAIIVEEYGMIGGFAILFAYLCLFFRFLRASHKAPTMFGKLLVVGLGFYIIFQALINMGVAVELLPTTGQTLPLVSSGGTSIWMTCISLGIILSVTKKEEEIKLEELEKEEKEKALQELLLKHMKEQQLALADMGDSLEDGNPMNAVRNK